MIFQVAPGQSIGLGIVEYVVVHNPGEQTTSFELITSLVRLLEIAPESEKPFPTASGGQRVALKNRGPDVLLVEPIRPTAAIQSN